MITKYSHYIGSDLSDPFFLEQIVLLDQTYFPRPWSKESWEDSMNSDHFLGLIYNNSNELVGYSLYFINHADSFAHLYKILINPEFRGFKLGEKLISESEKQLNEIGIKNFFLEVESGNKVAQALYLKNNYQIIHRKKKFYSDGQDAIIMTKST